MKTLTDQQVRDIFDYNKDTGIFTIIDHTVFMYKRNKTYTKETVQSAISIHIESRTGSKNLKVNVYGKQYIVAKLIWQWVYGGGYPKHKMHHIDKNNLNNKLDNLLLKSPTPINIAYIKNSIVYDPIEGTFTRNQNAAKNRGQQFLLKPDKYTKYHATLVKGRTVTAQQIAWILMTGELPLNFIDHKDGNKSNNKWDNLREVTESENSRNQKLNINNKSGCMGVLQTKYKTYQVSIANNENKSVFLGTFKTYEEAVKVRKEAERKYGYHANHGRKEE